MLKNARPVTFPSTLMRPPSTRLLSLLLPVIVLAAGCAKDPLAAKRRYVESADTYRADGNVPAAIIEYRNALKQDSLAGDVHEKLAAALLTAGDLPNALGEFARAADLRPDDRCDETRILLGRGKCG